MHPPQQVVRGGGEHAATLQFAAIGADPALPQPAEPEGGAIAAAKQPGLLVGPARAGVDAALPFEEAVGGQQGAAMAPGGAEERFLGHGLAAGVDRPPHPQRILAPLRQKAPQRQAHLQAAVLLALQQHRLARAHLLSRRVVLQQPRRQGALEPGQQLIDRGGEAVATAHGTRGWGDRPGDRAPGWHSVLPTGGRSGGWHTRLA